MKTYYALIIVCVCLTACKKNPTGLSGRWTFVSQKTYLEDVGRQPGFDTTYTGHKGDYYDFGSDGKVRIYAKSIQDAIDTFTYQFYGDTVNIMPNKAIIWAYRIQTLTDHAAILHSHTEVNYDRPGDTLITDDIVTLSR